MPISVKCSCGKAFKAPDKFAGKTVKCPDCSKPLAIKAIQQPSVEDTIVVSCPSCQKKFKVQSKLKGKKIKCPSCAGPIAVMADASPSPKAQGDSFDLDVPEQHKTCPMCRAKVEKTDVICVHCGTNIQTGVKLERTQKGEDLASGKEVFLYLGIIILILAVVGGAIFLFVK